MEKNSLALWQLKYCFELTSCLEQDQFPNIYLPVILYNRTEVKNQVLYYNSKTKTMLSRKKYGLMKENWKIITGLVLWFSTKKENFSFI